MASLQWVLRPTTPWKTWTPASSMLRAQRMLEASSKRAMSSTTRVVSLVAAASMSAWNMGESWLVRYRVCFMVTTAGVDGGVLNELDDGLVGIVGVMEQKVAVAQLVVDAGGGAAERKRLGSEGLELEVGGAARLR